MELCTTEYNDVSISAKNNRQVTKDKFSILVKSKSANNRRDPVDANIKSLLTGLTNTKAMLPASAPKPFIAIKEPKSNPPTENHSSKKRCD